jgi:signal peptidase I
MSFLRNGIIVVVLVLIVRGFIFEPFRIPSQSMLPTLLVGDHIWVKRYAYGLRVPGTKSWLAEFSDPQRGDVVVFTYPEDEDIDFVKRIVGLPGDVITIKDGELFVNHQDVKWEEYSFEHADRKDNCIADNTGESKTIVPHSLLPIPYFRQHRRYEHRIEKIGELKHYILHLNIDTFQQDKEVTVPERSYFVLGDNRDQSQDSRIWGFLPRENLKGKVSTVWLSLNNERTKCSGAPFGVDAPKVRWYRFGRDVY